MHSSGHLQERKLFKNQVHEFTRRIKSPEPVEENNTQGAAGAIKKQPLGQPFVHIFREPVQENDI